MESLGTTNTQINSYIDVNHKTVTKEKIIDLCARRGFVYPSSNIYGTFPGLYDIGHLGFLLKENIKKAWKKRLLGLDRNILFFESAILGPPILYDAVNCLEIFDTNVINCLVCNTTYHEFEIDTKKPGGCCNKLVWSAPRAFNKIFTSNIGVSIKLTPDLYIRPDTTQSIYVQLKNLVEHNQKQIPLGITHIDKVFRNEVRPHNFLFQLREFELWKLSWFCKPASADKELEFWVDQCEGFIKTLGINKDLIRTRINSKQELAYFSKGCKDVDNYFKGCVDIEYKYMWDWKDIALIAYFGSEEIQEHELFSGKKLSTFDQKTKSFFYPHHIEPSMCFERLLFTILYDAYHEINTQDGFRVILKLHPAIAPIKAAFLPQNKEMSESMRALYNDVKKKNIAVEFDDQGSIQERCYRQDEIGTPVSFINDLEFKTNSCILVRCRDTNKQELISSDNVLRYIEEEILNQQ